MSYYNSDGAAATSTTAGTVIVPGGNGLSIDTNGNLSNTGVLSINGNSGIITGIITTGDTGTITNTMLAGSIANAKLSNSAVTIGSTSISLGSNATTITGLTSVTSTSFAGALTGNVTGTVSGNAGTVTNGVYTTDTGTITNTMLAGSIDNTKLLNSSITVNGAVIALGGSGTATASATTLTGTSLNSTVVSSSLTSVGTLANLSVTNTISGSINGNSGTTTSLLTPRDINGVAFDGSAAITITAAAGTLTGTILNATVVSSSLTSVGTLTTLAVGPGTITQQPIAIVAGPLQTSNLVAGDMEYDGDALYFTPSGTQRGIVKSPQLYVLQANYPLTNQAATQSMFGKGVTLTGGNRYYYRILYTVYMSNNGRSTSALQYGMALTNGAVLAQHTYWVNPCGNSSQTTPTQTYQMSNHITAGFNTMVSITNSTSAAGYFSVIIDGNIDCTTTGTLTPQIGFSSSTPGTSSYTQAGATMEIYPIGVSGVNTLVGSWV